MIRREVSTAGGRKWILISQIDHARLSAELAEHWGAGKVAPLVDREALLWAIKHHDDGWRHWELAPDIEPASGAPRSFTEMELQVSLEIWRRSIELASARGPLAGYTVAGHFCALLTRFDQAWKRDPVRATAAQRFLDAQLRTKADCLAAWISQRTGNTIERAELALAQLQLFDNFSLWLCCEAEPAGDRIETPGGAVLSATPGRSATAGEPQVVVLDPWPMATGPLNLEVPGRTVAARRYENRDDLQSAPSKQVLLRWQLAPGSPSLVQGAANR